jgi:hypothetical protein
MNIRVKVTVVRRAGTAETGERDLNKNDTVLLLRLLMMI